ncbi:hypothetical protein [Shouchella clausii]|uniref:hypothetical protein n=1 Tax=Shouchella clausii TaxID=79880 RepID=UPI00226CFCD9|nr:hypothetical protein [Shouchella clausii]MCY1105873.1 hypothetical protein [Shouchella clausii]
MGRYPYRQVGTQFDRVRTDLNANFIDIEADIRRIEGAYRVEFTFHQNRTTTGVGSNWFDVGPYKSLLLEISGTAQDVSVEFKSNSGSGFVGIYGQNVSTLEFANSAGIGGGLWVLDITGHTQIMMDVARISGGDVTVKAVATTSSPSFITLPDTSGDMIRHVFHQNRTTTGAGTSPLPIPLDSSFSKVYVHISGSATSRTLEFKGVADNNEIVGVAAYDVLNDYASSKIATGGGNQIWLIEDVQAFKNLQVWISAISGGDVTVVGRAVKA